MKTSTNHTAKTLKSIAAIAFGATIAIMLSACLASEPKAEKPAAPVNLSCANISDIEIAKPGTNELNINADEVAQALYPKLNELCEKIPESYKVQVSYESKLDEATSTTNLTAQETKTATLAIELAFLSPGKEHSFKGSAWLEASGKKVLDIGESVQISQKDKQMMLNQAAKTAINEALKVFDKK